MPTSNARECLARSRAIITSACAILQEAQGRTVTFGREMYASSADCYVLLHDATKLFCRSLSQIDSDPATRPRWSPAVAELFLSHPDQCEQALAWLAGEDFQPTSAVWASDRNRDAHGDHRGSAELHSQGSGD